MGLFNPAVNPVEFVHKSADQTINNSTVLVDATDLAFDVGANEKWFFSLTLLFNFHPTPDGDLAWTVPALSTGAWYVRSAGVSTAQATSLTTEIKVNGTGTEALQILEGFYVGGANAGTVQLQFAQTLSNAADTTMRKGSTIRAWKLDG